MKKKKHDSERSFSKKVTFRHIFTIDFHDFSQKLVWKNYAFKVPSIRVYFPIQRVNIYDYCSK